MLEAFLDGVTASGLFGKRLWPGAPAELIDSRPVLKNVELTPIERVHSTRTQSNSESRHDLVRLLLRTVRLVEESSSLRVHK